MPVRGTAGPVGHERLRDAEVAVSTALGAASMRTFAGDVPVHEPGAVPCSRAQSRSWKPMHLSPGNAGRPARRMCAPRVLACSSSPSRADVGLGVDVEHARHVRVREPRHDLASWRGKYRDDLGLALEIRRRGEQTGAAQPASPRRRCIAPRRAGRHDVASRPMSDRRIVLALRGLDRSLAARSGSPGRTKPPVLRRAADATSRASRMADVKRQLADRFCAYASAATYCPGPRQRVDQLPRRSAAHTDAGLHVRRAHRRNSTAASDARKVVHRRDVTTATVHRARQIVRSRASHADAYGDTGAAHQRDETVCLHQRMARVVERHHGHAVGSRHAAARRARRHPVSARGRRSGRR